MGSDDHSTIGKVDNCDYDKEDPGREPADFPEGGMRAWMTLIGRFDYMIYMYLDSI
jgi:hypothetical protein